MPREYGCKVGFIAGFLLPLAVTAFAVGFSNGTVAQSLPGVTSDLLNQAQQQVGSPGQSGLPGGATSQVQNLPPSITLQPLLPNSFLTPRTSRLEQIMSSRARSALQQFGYDQLGKGAPVTIPETGAIQDDYVLGPGDEIIVSLRGQENAEFRAVVDRNGQVVVPRLSPVPASGRNLGDFRQDLDAAVHRAYVATNASISVGRVRQISVLVSGEVNSPGQRLLTGLSSVVDALLLSGGVKKTGSLRDVRIQRRGHEFAVDLYSVLTSQGSASPFRLADGDRILVPTLGKTVAVTGLVRRPGIYELPRQQPSISATNLLALGGGLEVRGNYRLSIMHINESGRSVLTTAVDRTGVIRDSEILFVDLAADQITNQALLSGGVGLAGAYPVTPGTRLSEVLKAPGALGSSPYSLFGVISRRDPRTLLRTLVAFTPVAVLNGTEDEVLQSDDIVHPLTLKEARLVTSTIQVFVQQRVQDEQVMLNPLSVISNAQPSAIVSTPTTGANNTQSAALASNPGSNPPNSPSTLMEKSSRSAAEIAQDEETEIQLIGSFNQRQLDIVTSGQAKVTDFRYLPFDRTQEPAGQGVYLPFSADPTVAASIAILQQQQQQNNSTILANGVNQNGQGPTNSLQQPPIYDQNGQLVQQNNGYNEQNRRPPAPNYQEEPLATEAFPTNREAPTLIALAQQLGVDPLVLVNFITDHQVTLDGAVRGPGSYFVGPGATLKDLVAAAGGTINWADNSGVELISTAIDANTGRSLTQHVQLPLQQGLLANYVVKPHDGFRFNEVFNDGNVGNVTIEGEVRYKGSYRITRGEHLSDLLAQAGGLTSTAYPYGTVFLRKSAADAERQGYIRAANEIQDQLVVAMTRIGNDKIDPATFVSMQAFVNQLRTQPAAGRISITADPSLLVAKPELDPLLESGDVVYIPQRPTTVAVLGQVSQPGNFSYRSGQTMADYIEQAGGFASTSDQSMTFVVMPDGSARKLQSSWLGFSNENIPPGSTIVVPRDVTPFDTRQVILDISSIFSQLAVSAASLAVLATQVK